MKWEPGKLRASRARTHNCIQCDGDIEDHSTKTRCGQQPRFETGYSEDIGN